MSNWKGNLAPALLLTMALLAACGGGGNKATAVEADKDFPAAAASQTFANSAAGEVNDLVEEIQQADLAAGLPVAARIVGPLSGTTSSGSINCSDLGESGSGTVSYTYTYNNSKPVSWSYTYHDCQFSSGSYTLTLNGTMKITYTSYQDATHNAFTYSYNLSYSYVGPDLNYSANINAAESCTISGESYECRYRVGGGYTLDDYDVEYDGDTVTVNSATITTNNATIVFTDWVYDVSLGYATSGSILVTYGNGNSVAITATGTAYDVDITINGVTTSYTVLFST